MTLFFAAVVLMGLPMFRIDRRRWLVTLTTASMLIVAMLHATADGSRLRRDVHGRRRRS